MDNYKIAIIYGNNDDKRNIKDGSIELLGKQTQDDLHIMNLINYLNEKYSDVDFFKQITIRHMPEIPSYFITQFGHAVFLNMTKNVQKYGKCGMFLMPDNISNMQKKTLYEFCNTISDYSITIFYDLKLDYGILDGKQIIGAFKKSPKDLLDQFFKEKENKPEVNIHK